MPQGPPLPRRGPGATTLIATAESYDKELEKARRDYETLDADRRRGVDAYCSRFRYNWRDCFISRVARTKAYVDKQKQELQERLDAHRKREAERLARRAAPPKPEAKPQEQRPDIATRRARLLQQRTGRNNRTYKDVCEDIIENNRIRQRSGKPLVPVPWYCEDEETAVRTERAKEQDTLSAASQRRREATPPALRPRTAGEELERERRRQGFTYYGPGESPRRRV